MTVLYSTVPFLTASVTIAVNNVCHDVIRVESSLVIRTTEYILVYYLEHVHYSGSKYGL
jgi:hypothetical protein